DLWKLCEVYGKVVDVFIHNHKSKAGKRLAFDRFIRVEDLDRLIGSYVAAVNDTNIPHVINAPFSCSPALVLDDTCVNTDDLSRYVMGKDIDLNSIPNLHTILTKEGFAMVELSYLGVIFKGKVNFVRAKELFTWTPCFLEYKEFGYVSDDESIRDTNNKPDESQLGGDALVNANKDEQQSKDSFGFYILLKKPNTNIFDDTEPSLSHPLGFTPQDYHVDETLSGLPTRIHSRTTSNGGSILEILDGMIKRILWDYISGLINRWKGETIVLEDFNVVRFEEEMFEELDKSITTDEIRVVVWDCVENKSPGSDGYTFEFFRHFWNLIGPDVCSAVLCFFDHVVTKILDNRLAMVISDLVSNTQSTFVIGGRLTLLKSVLRAVPIYNMSTYKNPKDVLHEMEMLRNKFFNGIDVSESKITWVAWDKVLASKKKGGLGVSSFFALNRALLLKWVLRFLSQDGSLWLHVICAIYGPRLESHSFCINSTWGSILRESQAFALKGFDFLSYCKP
nr:RNA-directed DNA polymerase, eukaryota, reverse transcriptase zinc-binding domain protein [Tanacetum cinerariifolium]